MLWPLFKPYFSGIKIYNIANVYFGHFGHLHIFGHFPVSYFTTFLQIVFPFYNFMIFYKIDSCALSYNTYYGRNLLRNCDGWIFTLKVKTYISIGFPSRHFYIICIEQFVGCSCVLYKLVILL